ncbi:hypothetical protein [Methylobacterium brachythecii]|uniref:Uncharacterized protein n=1 Tax=Methylobacterium brachythecii TaxID=1176177 RepID=A0A7W6F8Y7_9HYPH|nr:hypothetical protein [Methylobacterium brachythecii]MBB3904925.1 hypothetical protein [Methylobacterium brachythecii]GLS46685.1 hypothetical protein GCM10007884_46790 [Methylobacterium brachythecii]
MPTITTLAETLVRFAKPGMTAKELLAAVREQHPESTKKEVVRAAFYALTEGHPIDPERARELHGFAIGARASDEDGPIKRGKLRKKKHAKTDREAPVG